MSLPQRYKKLVAVQPHEDLRQAVEVQEVELAPPAPDEIIVKTRYAGVNAADYLMAQGRYLAPTPPPFDLGGEACGEVAAVGSDVKHLKEGDHIMALAGGYREYFTMNASHAIPVQSATAGVVALGVSGLTASIALEEIGEMSTDETVLVTAAAGGTGNFVVQLAAIAGNHVIGTCGSAAKVEFLERIGCHRPINYREESVKDVLKEEYPDGLNLVFESVGGELYDIALRSLAVKGRMILIGAISEYESGPDIVERPRVLYQLLQKSASLRGFWLMHHIRQAPAHIQKLQSLIMEGKLHLAVDEGKFTGVMGAIDAIEHLYAGNNVGKVVVDFTV